MIRPRCGTGGDQSGRLYFCSPITLYGNYFYLPSLSLSLHLAHLCCHCLSLSLPLVRPALVLTHALHILFLFLFLCPRHHSSQLTSSHSSLGVKYHRSQGERAVQELFFIFHLFKFILPLCVLLFISLPTDLEQLSNRAGSSALTITTKSLRGFLTLLCPKWTS